MLHVSLTCRMLFMGVVFGFRYARPGCKALNFSRHDALRAGRGEELDPATMGMTPENHAHAAYDKFSQHWAAELKHKDNQDGPKPR